MKLRNKKTGEIVLATNMAVGFADDGTDNWYNSLAELNEEWEDYKPKEPLIKDEKVRKAVRAWAEANDVEDVFTCETVNAWGVKNKLDDDHKEEYMLADILFRGKRPEELAFGTEYTIAELCGEEEAPELGGKHEA